MLPSFHSLSIKKFCQSYGNQESVVFHLLVEALYCKTTFDYSFKISVGLSVWKQRVFGKASIYELSDVHMGRGEYLKIPMYI